MSSKKPDPRYYDDSHDFRDDRVLREQKRKKGRCDTKKTLREIRELIESGDYENIIDMEGELDEDNNR